MFALLLLACQEPFGTDRHVLEGDRIAAVAVSRDGDEVTLVPALVVDGHLWSDAPVEVVTGTDDAGRATLTVTFPSGAVREAVADVPDAEGAVTLDDVALAVVDDLAFEGLTVAALARDARLDASATPAAAVPPGAFARLTATTDATDPTVRWMGAGGGTFFELDATRADWASGAVVLDDEEVVSAAPRIAGVEGLLALALGSDGRTAWRAFDVCVGDPVGLDVNGRRLPLDAVPAQGLWRGTLVADDTVPAGVGLEGAVQVLADDLPLGDPFGTEALGCGDGPFDPSWLASAACLRSDVVGATVVVEAR